MKKIMLLLMLIPALVKAQDGRLMIQGANGNFYLDHTTALKENYYSIGRLYNISPKEIAPYNNLVLEKGLGLGKAIRIPLTSNFTQAPAPAADEAAVPLYHKVGAKETLTQISNKYNKVSFASLRSWNALNTDALKPGQDIIVGYLKVKKELSAFADKAAPVPAVKEETKPTVESPVKKEPVAVTVPIEPKVAKAAPAVVKNDEAAYKKAVTVVPVKNTPAGLGAFRSLYNDGGKELNGEAGVFKSTAGWEDGKYYCLQNTVPAGTVVKISNPATGKSIYAKVLDMMPDLKQNSDLLIRVSNAAAEALGVGENNFNCTINY